MLNSSNMTPINNESVVQQIINKIMDAIIAGEMKPGEKIPTELELIKLLHVTYIPAISMFLPNLIS